MTQVKRRASALNPIEIFKQHMALKGEASSISARADKMKADLKAWLPEARGVYTNEQGSKFYDFDETVEIKGTKFKGMELRRSAGTLFDEDEAVKICNRKKIDPSEYTETVTVIDQDKILRLQAQGRLSEKDLDKIITEKAPSWAFWPVKGEVL